MPTRSTLLLALLLSANGAAQNLVVNDLHPQVMVYEIPDVPGRAEAVKYVESIRDRFHAGVEIIDANSLPEDALRQKLKGTICLYTLLGSDSRLLRMAAQPLPLKIDDGTLHWGAISAPVARVRMVFVGRNPYGDGSSVVYAAGTAALLAAANNVFHGPSSYVIYQGEGRGQLLAEGTYDRNFVERSDHLSAAQATADIQEFFSTLEKTHPHLLAHISKPDYEALKKKTLSDFPNPCRLADLAWRLSYAGARFKDGHTGVFWGGPRLTESNTRDKRFPPFWLDSENGRFFITSASDASLAGAEVVGVNGATVDEFVKPILERISGETRTYRAALFVQRQTFWYWFSNVFAAESYTLRVRDASGVSRDAALRTIGFLEFQKLAPPDKPRQRTHVEFVDDGKVAHLVIPSLVYAACSATIRSPG